ncbi:MAG TPA: hypothetical protein VFF28_04150 [Candidatus Nanoarchaeia archaeon]|nr:hypothetical protein [Candidatus Nanoarchaeia archaeon]
MKVMSSNIKIALSILIIAALAAFIVNINDLIPKEAPLLPTAGTDNSGKDYSDCFGESPGTVLFVYSNSCPHCQNMKSIIKELEKEGYKFYWAEGSDPEARDIIDQCFSDIIGGYVPQFICPANGQEKTGEMTKAELKNFADSCASS